MNIKYESFILNTNKNLISINLKKFILQNSCFLRARPSSFSVVEACPDPYAGQLFIQYQCVDYFGLNSTINKCNTNPDVPLICPATSDSQVLDATACDTDNSPMTLNCSSGKNIQIVCAFYGLHPALTKCTLPSPVPICYFASSFTNVTSTCGGQQSCSITFLNTFNDPCNGMDKGLYVQYKCV